MEALDDSILEEIRQYYADELDTRRAEELERLLDSDPAYARHEKWFRAIDRGVLSAQRKDTPNLKEVSLEERQLLKQLKKNDQRHTVWRRVFLLFLIIAIGGAVAYWVWPSAESSVNRAPSALEEQPIAGNVEEEEELFGGAGQSVQIDIPIFRYYGSSAAYRNTDSTQPLVLRKSSRTELSYYFEDGQLFLLTEAFENLRTEKMELLQSGQQLYLRIGNNTYEIDQNNELPTALEE